MIRSPFWTWLKRPSRFSKGHSARVVRDSRQGRLHLEILEDRTLLNATVSDVTLVPPPAANSTVGTGATVTVEVDFSQAVNVDTTNGTPSIALNDSAGSTASYLSGSGSTALLFQFSVPSGDSTGATPLDIAASSIALNGGTITPTAGGTASLTLPSPGAGDNLPGAGIYVQANAPTITASTANLAQNATTLTITGTNFDPTPANDSVSFDDGAAGTVTAATPTQLTVTLTTPPTNTGELDATVTTAESGSNTAQVATVVAAPTVTASTANLAINAPTITITGTGFDTTTANDSVSFSDGAVGTVESATATTLTVQLTTPPTNTGELDATVTVDGGSSGDPVQVANVVAAPTVTVSTANLAQNATTITINGTGFDTNTANDSVSFDDGAVGTVTNATATTLTVSLTTPPTNTGELDATVTVDGGISNTAPVATVVAAPTVTVSTANLAQSATTLTITGTGFDTNTANDSVTLAAGVTGTVQSVSADGTSMTVSLSGLSSESAGFPLFAYVTVDGGISNTAQVATVVATPTVTASTANLAINAPTITITGTGFDTNTVNDSVSFTDGAVGTVESSTGTTLTVQLTTPPTNTGELDATVTVDGGSSGDPVQVATVVAAPTVTVNSANLAINAPTITITGTGFDTTKANDSVFFDDGAVGTVTAATATTLTVTLTSPPTNTGELDAQVVVDGGSSNIAQVATVVAAPTVTASTANLAINAPTITITGTGFDTTKANDSVTFDDGAVGTVTAATATQLTVSLTTPPSATGALHATVTVDGGSSNTAQVATVVGLPTITSITPTSGTAAGGTSLTISGSNLANATSVTIGGVAATITSDTATSITVTTPAGTAGAADVVVTTAGGTATDTGAYTYVAASTPTPPSLYQAAVTLFIDGVELVLDEVGLGSLLHLPAQSEVIASIQSNLPYAGIYGQLVVQAGEIAAINALSGSGS